jgi:transcriptional regulator with XRE-family HTH domain
MNTLNDKMKNLSPARRRKVQMRAEHLIRQEMTRQELRVARKRTQVKLAKDLGISQDGVSRIERRTDLLLSTLRQYVKALGGDLSLIAEFPDGEPVKLSGIAEDQCDSKRHARELASRLSIARIWGQRLRDIEK